MAVERYDLLERLAAKLPDDALVMATYIGAISFEWAAITGEHPRRRTSARWVTSWVWRSGWRWPSPTARSCVSTVTARC